MGNQNRLHNKSAGICPEDPSGTVCVRVPTASSQRSLVIIRCLLFVITRMTQEKILTTGQGLSAAGLPSSECTLLRT